MRPLTFIISTLFAFNLYATSLLDSAYNTINFSYNSAFGDVDSSGTDANITFKPSDVDFVLSYSHSDLDIEKVIGHDVSSLERNRDNYSLHYVITYNPNTHIVPFISAGSGSYFHDENNEISDYDFTSLGIILRKLYDENSILNIELSHTNYDDLSLSALFRSGLNAVNPTLSDTQFDSIESELSEKDILLGLSLEHHYDNNVSLAYGLSTNFNTVKFSLNLGWNY